KKRSAQLVAGRAHRSLLGPLSQEVADRVPVEPAACQRLLHAPPVDVRRKPGVATPKLLQPRRRAALFTRERAAFEIRILLEEGIQLADQGVRDPAPPELHLEKPPTLRRLEELRSQKRPHERAVVHERDPAQALERPRHGIALVATIPKPDF